MLSPNLKWYFPKSAAKAVQLINQPGVFLHSGGTRILKTQSRGVTGLVDIGNLKLNYIKQKNNSYIIGSAVTFNEVIKYSKENSCLNLLASSLSLAASTPLRNRITIGGSVKDFPLWSNLFAPLIALDAKVVINNGKTQTISIEDYINEGIIKSKHLVKEIIVPDDKNFVWRVKRFTLIKFEYPIFNIAVAFQMTGNLIEDARVVITGVKSRYKRFKKAEKVFTGKILSDELLQPALKFIDPKFVSDYKYTSAYKERTAKIYFADLLSDILKGEQ